jgi:hypothetical protein
MRECAALRWVRQLPLVLLAGDEEAPGARSVVVKVDVVSCGSSWARIRVV